MDWPLFYTFAKIVENLEEIYNSQRTNPFSLYRIIIY